MSRENERKQPIIIVEDMTKIYQLGEYEVHALAGVSLKIYEREFMSIMGPSGSGVCSKLSMAATTRSLKYPSG